MVVQLHTPNFNGSLDTAIKRKGKYKVRQDRNSVLSSNKKFYLPARFINVGPFRNIKWRSRFKISRLLHVFDYKCKIKKVRRSRIFKCDKVRNKLQQNW